MAESFTGRRVPNGCCRFESQHPCANLLQLFHVLIFSVIINVTVVVKLHVLGLDTYGFGRFDFGNDYKFNEYENLNERMAPLNVKLPYLINVGNFNCYMFNDEQSVKIIVKQNYTAKLKRSNHVTVYNGFAPGLSNKVICSCSSLLEIKCTGGLVEFPIFDQHQFTFETLPPVDKFTNDRKDGHFRQNIGIKISNKIVYRTLNVNEQFISSLGSHQFLKIKFRSILANNNQIGNDINERAFAGLEDSLRELQLGACRLKLLPENLLEGLDQLQRLFIWGNWISQFPKNFFSKAKNLRELVMWGNRIERLDNNTLAGLWSLRRLDMDRNKIEYLDSLAFRHLIELEVLTLSGNRIKTINSDTFTFMSKLKVLILDNNQLKNLFPGAFSNLENLSILSLNDNQINHMPDTLFHGLKSLTRLWISNNSINSLRSNSFSFLKSLQDLRLSDNDLTNLPDKLFRTTTRLKHLTFDNNKLQSIVRCLFPKKFRLKSLSLLGNSLKCDCKSEWLSHLCQPPYPSIMNQRGVQLLTQEHQTNINATTDSRHAHPYKAHRRHLPQQQQYTKQHHYMSDVWGMCYESLNNGSAMGISSNKAKYLGINHLCWPMYGALKDKCREKKTDCVYE